MTVSPRGRRAPAGWLLPEPLAAKVPEITAWFWVVKILTTAAGEATSDALKTLGNIKGGGVEVLLFLVGIVLQFRSRRYSAISYWFLAYAIATFGTGVADFLHLDVGIPYAGTTIMWALILAVVFVTWYRSEHTLSIHSITTTRRELFYWATVFATFALGTALGDFTASEMGLGYFASAVLFTVVILVPAVAYRWFGMNSIAAFWFAYVVTRPLGASYADYISKPPNISGAGFGDAPTAILLGLAIVVCVAYLAVARPDAQVALAATARRPDPDGPLRSRGAPPGGPGPRSGDALDGGVVDPGSDRGGRTTPGRRHLGGWPPRQPGVQQAAGPRQAPLPQPPVVPRRPPAPGGPVAGMPPRPAAAPVPPSRPVTRPARPAARPAQPVQPGPPSPPERPDPAPRPRAPQPPSAPQAGPNPDQGREPERFDPLLRDLLAWGLVEPGAPAEEGATWHLAEGAQHRLEDLHHQAEMHGSRPVYFDRVCAGCRRRRLTRRHGDAFLCDACLAGARTSDPGGGDRRG